MVKKYNLGKVVDCLRIFTSSTTSHEGSSYNRINSFLNNLSVLGAKCIIDEISLIRISDTFVCKRDLVAEIMLISETRAKYKIIKSSELDSFISEQLSLGILVQCVGCNKPFSKITNDHIYPKSKGGIDHPFNMQNMCFFCNTKKGNDVEKKPFLEVYYHKDCKVLLPVHQAKNIGIVLNKSPLKGKVYADNPHILQLPNLT
jgi:hypothetical protein